MPQDRVPIRLGLSGCAGGLESRSDRGLLDLARMADDLGFEALWLNDEQFQGGSTPEEGRRCLSPLILAAAMAAVTSRIRIGSSLLVLPLHQPIILAAQLASLDVLSTGRIDMGVSRGVQPQYGAAFGLDPDTVPARFDAGIDLLRQAPSGEPVQIAYQSFRVEPKPVQGPTAPIQFGTYSADTAAWAARTRLRLICHGINSRAALHPVIAAFRDNGGDMDNLPLGRFIHVAETDAEAVAQGRPAVAHLTARMRRARLFGRPGIITKPELDPERYLDAMVIAGSPRTVARKIAVLCAEVGVLNVRLPRVLAAAFVGAGQAAAGAASQNLFRNLPVAPDILGISAGAGFGASLAAMLGLGMAVTQGMAFAMGLAAVGIAYGMARLANRQSLIVLVLLGVVTAALFQVLISVVKILVDPTNTLPIITFWLMGGLNKITAPDLPLAGLLIAGSAAVLYVMRWSINTLSLGEDEARQLGIDVGLVRLALILSAALITAAAVSIAGIIGWIGLIAPHAARTTC